MLQGHTFDPSVLRAYDIRGIYRDTLNENDAYAVGRTHASNAAEEGARSIALGWDGRDTSPRLSNAVAQGIVDTGLDVKRIGCGPTPMLYYAVHLLRADGGIMVTGSHNPPEYNGFKLMMGHRTLGGEEIQALGRRARRGDFVGGTGRDETVDIVDEYVDRLIRGLHLGGGFACGWDPGHGAVAQVLKPLIDRIPGAHIAINNSVDAGFPSHHPDPSQPENMAELIKLTTEHNLDLGFAFDGDGDRLGVVDGRGRIVWPDQLLVLLARQVLRERPGQTIIADVKASQVLFDEVTRMGGEALMWKTGHSLIKAKMRETRAPLAGEMSGHIFYGDRWYGFDDAIYAALRTIEALADVGRPLAEVVDDLPVTVATPEIRIDCEDDVKFDVIDRVGRSLNGSSSEVIDIDGVRVKTEDGWWLLRASNTQPALVARCEGANGEGLLRLRGQLNDALRKAGVGVEFPNEDDAMRRTA